MCLGDPGSGERGDEALVFRHTARELIRRAVSNNISPFQIRDDLLQS